jgi:hypothetical protein
MRSGEWPNEQQFGVRVVTMTYTLVMKSIFRATTSGDLSAIRALLQQAFGVPSSVPFLDPAVMQWKYWTHRDDWTEPRSYVLEKNGAIAAHAGIWPVIYETGEQAIRGIQMIDWASAKDSPGAGLSLVQKLAAKFDFIYSLGGSEMTEKILPAFGFVEHSREWRGARPIRPVQHILTHQTRNWKLAPRLVRNFMWSLQKGSGRNQDWQVEELAPQNISSALFSKEMQEARSSPRPPAFFEYLATCPSGEFSLHGLTKAGRQQGHFALVLIRGQARVAGVWLLDPSLENWRTAYALAREAAARIKGAYEIAVAGTTAVSAQAATESGLRVTPGRPVYLLNKKGKFNVPKDFQFQLSDDDAVFLDPGESVYWT